MNILFKEFAEKATTVIEATETSAEGWIFNKEKFAKLIVEECNRYACSAWEHGPLLGRDLLIHFGMVEMNDE
tara:strand:- start:99 stop:314 length:216 start_codon:yes stop_codon:yes gene_type:complete